MVNMSTLAVIMAVPALVWAGTGKGDGPLETTVQVERFVGKLEHATTIHPDTLRQIERLMSRPPYDCNHKGCSEQLHARIGTVRSRLETLIASRSPLNDGAIASKQQHLQR